MTDPAEVAAEPNGSPGAAERPVHHAGALRATAARSARWAVIQMVGATGGRLLFSLLFARLLGPENFGVMAAAMVYIAFVMLLLDQGFGAALVQRQDLRGGDVRTVSTINLALALGFMVVTLFGAPLVADFFATPELTAVLRVLGIGLIVKALTIVPLMLSRRDFMFRELALMQVIAVLVGGCSGLVVIASGGGYWALVVQTIVTDAVVLLVLLRKRGLPRFGFDRTRLRGLFRFSSALVGAQLMIFAGHNSDNVAIGKVLGPTALAYYAVAYRLQRFPLQLIGSAVNDVALPIFSRLQDDREKMGGWFITATRFVVLIVWPILVLMAVGADTGVPLLFGPKWEPAIAPLQLLTIAGLATISRWLLGPLCTACGRTDVVLKWTAINVTLLVVSFLVSVHWGISAVALSVAAVALIVAIPHTVYVARIVELPWGRFLGAHVPVAVGCVVIAVVWRSLAWILGRADASAPIVLVAATLPAVGGYAITVRALWPTVVAECRALATLSAGGTRSDGAHRLRRIDIAAD